MAKSKVGGVYDNRRKLKFLKNLATSSHVANSAKAAGVAVQVSHATFLAGDIPEVLLVEVRETS